jgi:exopolysaccharide biosynthesis WecB/TagA/CpsF family protein
MRTHIEFLGLQFDDLTADALLAEWKARAPDAPFAFWVTPNVDHMVRLHDRSADDGDRIWAAYRKARWCSCDSRILAVLARRQGITLPVVPGSDMTPFVLDRVCRPGDRIAIVGGNDATARALAVRYPMLDIVHHQPPMGMRRKPAAIDAAAAFVAGARARFVFLAVGSPQQELLAARIVERGDATGIGLCIGASIEFVVGDSRRAPRAVQQLHLEWAFRLLADPKRLWRRYLIDGPRIFRLVREHYPRD